MNATLADILLKAHNAGHFGKQGKIPAHAHVHTGVNGSAELTHQNIASQNALTAKTLYAAALAFTVATVARRAACFLMCHGSLPGAPTLWTGGAK